MWMKGDAGVHSEKLIDRAIEAATLGRTVLADAVREAAEPKHRGLDKESNGQIKKPAAQPEDIDMDG